MVPHQGDEEEQAAQPGAEGSRGQSSGVRTSATAAGSGRRASGRSSSSRRGRRAKPSSRSRREQGIDADGVPGVGQFALDVVDGEVAFPHGDDQVADADRGRGRSAAPWGWRKKNARGSRDRGGTDGRGRGRSPGCSRSGGRPRRGELLDEVRRAGPRTGVGRGCGGRKKLWLAGIVKESDSQCWIPYFDDATET